MKILVTSPSELELVRCARREASCLQGMRLSDIRGADKKRIVVLLRQLAFFLEHYETAILDISTAPDILAARGNALDLRTAISGKGNE